MPPFKAPVNLESGAVHRHDGGCAKIERALQMRWAVETTGNKDDSDAAEQVQLFQAISPVSVVDGSAPPGRRLASRVSHVAWRLGCRHQRASAATTLTDNSHHGGGALPPRPSFTQHTKLGPSRVAVLALTNCPVTSAVRSLCHVTCSPLVPEQRITVNVVPWCLCILSARGRTA